MRDESELIERWEGWLRSIEQRDVEAASGYLDADYALQLVQPRASVVGRADWLKTLPDYVVSSYTVEERIIAVDGDLGVILHRAAMQATVFNRDRSGTFVVTDVWRRRDGAWRVWRRHSTPLHAGPMPERTER